MLAMLGINKLLALYVGPSGYAVVGQFQNVVTIATNISGSGLSVGITKYTAEFGGNEEKQVMIWRSAGTIGISLSFVTASLVAIFSRELSLYLFKSISYSSIFIWLGAGLVFFTLNTFFLAILNGKKEIERYVVANVAGSFLSIFVTGVLIWFYGLYGALVALSIYQSLNGIVTIFICSRRPWFKYRYFFGQVDPVAAINLTKFALMALVTAICVPVSQLLIRQHLLENLGFESAGYWEAMCRLSAAYLLFITTTFGVYYLPRISELIDNQKIMAEIRMGMITVLPVTIIFALAIYLFRDFIIDVLFTSDFVKIRSLFALQLLGDVLKVASWLFSFVMLGKAMFKFYIITEIMFSISFVLLSIQLVDSYGLVGTVMAHAFNYFMYGVVVGGGVWWHLTRIDTSDGY
jgi:PST family polysaccharide transporter